jgi:hypothetical protein
MKQPARTGRRLEDLLKAGGWPDGLLRYCCALDPQWFERLQDLTAFKRLVDLGVSKDELLRALAFVRLNSSNKTLRVNAARFANVTTQLGAAATALESLPHLPSSTLDLVQCATIATAVKALGAFSSTDYPTRWVEIPASIDLRSLSDEQKSSLATFAWLLSPKHLAASLRTLADYYDRLAETLKPAGKVKDSARTLFLWLVPALVESATGWKHHAEVATLYGFVFNVPPPDNIARLRSKVGPMPQKL